MQHPLLATLTAMQGIGTSANTPNDRGLKTDAVTPENPPTAAAQVVTAAVFVLALAFFVACLGVLFAAVRWVW